MENICKDIWELLPWDIQVDILSRLSTKDLLEVEGICKNWQSIIKSPRFHMLQIKANPNQDAIIMHSDYEHAYIVGKGQIQPLGTSEVYEFDIPGLPNCNFPIQILATSNGLVLVNVISGFYKIIQLMVFNPITKQFVELPQLSILNHYSAYDIVCDFFEHDLQFSTYKIFLACYQRACIYSSSSNTWQNLDSFPNNICDEFNTRLCIMYKNHIYVAISDRKDDESMMAIYDPINDAWNKFNLNIEKHERYSSRLIIVANRLFFPNAYRDIHNYISIFEMKTKDRLLIPIIKIVRPKSMQHEYCKH